MVAKAAVPCYHLVRNGGEPGDLFYSRRALRSRQHYKDVQPPFPRCGGHERGPERILKQLKGKKRLIIGNHDGSWMSRAELGRYFVSVDKYLETSDGAHALTLCHYPLLTWNHARRSYMIHGHIHANTDADFWPLLRGRNNVLNAGVDINGYAPVPFDELLENNRRFKSEH